MRPDLDDYDALDEAAPEGGSRAMSWMVLAVAVVGFSALAYYAYRSGSQAVSDGEVMVVEADASPIKQPPSDPQGEQFPDKDKTIYDVLNNQGGAAAVEKLMPEPERPLPAANFEDMAEEPPVSPQPSAASPAAPAPVVAQTPASTPPAPTAASTNLAGNVSAPSPTVTPPAATVDKAPQAPVLAPAAVTPAASAAAAPSEKSFSAPEIINEKTLTGKKEAPAATAQVNEKPKAAAKPKAEKPAPKAAAGGAYKLQLGAFKSESEASAAWKKISAKHSAVLSGSPTIVKADVNGATFYRLRAGSYASADAAKAACAKLGGQACFPVK